MILYGKGVPKKGNANEAERYGLCILMLFKPWETVHDLCGDYESWSSACRAFMNDGSLSPRLRNIIDNIELLHRCSEETALDRELREKARQDASLTKALRIERSVPGYDAMEELALFDEQDDPRTNIAVYGDEAEFDPIAITKSGLKDRAGIDQAILPLRIRGRLPMDDDMPPSSPTSSMDIDEPGWIEDLMISHSVRASNDHDESLVKLWRTTITSRNAADQNDDNMEMTDDPLPSAYTEPQINANQSLSLDANVMGKDVDPLDELAAELNEEQRRAFFLVCDHRRRNHPDNMNPPSQLLLYLPGAGGTGKSRVIQAITEYFQRTGQRATLLILAPTGIAAANISGSTIHSVCGFGFNDREDGKRMDSPTGKALHNLQERWAKIEYVIIDEVSMIGQTLLARFHASVQKAKAVDSDAPFAGLNVLFSGDFMQLSPVQDIPLYMPNKVTRVVNPSDAEPKGFKRKRNSSSSSIGANTVVNAIGRDLWLSVKHVVQLKKPMRQVDDPFYTSILENMRQGCLTNDQQDVLRSRILGDDRIDTDEWRDASFLVARNEVRVQINFDAARQHASDSRQPIIYSCAVDTYRKIPLTGRHRRAFLSTPDTKENSLAGILPLSIGMKVVLTINVCTNDGLANGAQGILRKIVYDQDAIDHSCSRQGKAIVLKKPPKYVVVELSGGSCGTYGSLPENHVPVYPIKRACVRTIWQHQGDKLLKRFQRFQLPLTPAFAFTDYKCQGRTLQKTIVDLAGGCSTVGAYVMLSRAQRLEDLLILRPFNESILSMRIPQALQVEFRRFDECAENTNSLEMWPSN